MGLVFANMIKNGLIYRNKNYTKTEPHTITTKQYSSFTKRIIPSLGTEQTTGYATTFSFTSSTFDLYRYDDPETPLTSLPEYKIVLCKNEEIVISGLSLVYNGDGTFSLSGELNITGVYSSSKTADVCLNLVDKDGNLFLSKTSSILSSSTNSSSVEVNYISTSLTYEKDTITTKTKKDIVLPFIPADNIPASEPTYYGTSSVVPANKQVIPTSTTTIY